MQRHSVFGVIVNRNYPNSRKLSQACIIIFHRIIDLMCLLLLSFLQITSTYLCLLPFLASEKILINYTSSDLTLAIFDLTLVTNLQTPAMGMCI